MKPMNRRTFLKNTGAMALGGIVADHIWSNYAEAAESKRSVRKTRLREHVDGLVAAGSPPCMGVVALHKGKRLASYWAGHELPNDPASRSITPTTRFNVGSVTKPVTGALIFKLVEEGRLTLDDKVIAHIPEFAYDDVTLLHLMTHTSGYDSTQAAPWPTQPDQVPDYFAKIYALKPRQHKLDEVCSYWTVGYSILMDVIQRVTGESIETYAQRVLFKPLGMKATNYDINCIPADDLILPYDGKILLKSLRNAPPTGDSGLLTTAEDLVRFGQAVLTGKNAHGKRIFTPETVDRMLTECTKDRFKRTPLFFYHGSNKMESCFGKTASSHAVGHPGFSGCYLFLVPEQSNVMALTSNGMRYHDVWSNYGQVCDVLFEA